MKRYFTLFLVMFCAMYVIAQELTVKSFVLDQNDLTASTQERKDANGDACALIKVLLATPSATFAGNIVGNVTYDVNHYWVYMTSGSKKLQINHPNYLTLDVNFADYGVNSVKGKQTYVLTVTMPADVTATTTDLGGNYLVMTVKPANSTVKIDGKYITLESSGEYMKTFSYGMHSYSVSLAGYVEKTGTFNIERGKKTELNVNLESALATLTVTCPTAEANIYIDSKLVGTSPWTGSLQDGMYIIEAKKDGYRSVRKSVTLAERQKLAVSLEPLSPIVGILDIAYRPIGADIYVDGKKSGTTPSILTDILVGSHKVEIRKDGYTSEIKNISISEGKTVTLQGSLSAVASTSGLSLNTTVSSINNGSHEYVDLGLSVKWATCNVGAGKPEEYGDYFAWGETASKKYYSWKKYKYCKGSYNTQTKYCTKSSYGTVDYKTVLDLEDDAVHVNWGGSWRMPTKEEQEELRTKCTWTWTSRNGVNGYKVTSKENGNSIFLPAAGDRWDSGSGLNPVGFYGYYWSSSLNSGYPYYAYYLYFHSTNVEWNSDHRFYGFAVRPVCP